MLEVGLSHCDFPATQETSHSTYSSDLTEFLFRLYEFARAALTKYYKLSSLDNISLLSHSSESGSPR